MKKRMLMAVVFMSLFCVSSFTGNAMVVAHNSTYGTSVTSSKKNLDDLLDDFEECIDKTILVKQKVDNGNKFALLKLPRLMLKAKKMVKKLKKAKEEKSLSVEQIERMGQLLEKYKKLLDK